MDRSHWLVNSNRSRIKRFIENANNKDQFFKHMFIDSGKVTSTWSKEPLVITTRKRIKERSSLRRMGKINCSGLEKNRGRLDKKK